MKKLLLSFAVVLMFGLTKVNAQVESVVTSQIKPVVDLTVISGDTDVDFIFDNVVKLTDGIIKSNAFTLQTKSNKAYYVTVLASGENFGGGDQTDPLSVETLGVSINSELINFIPLSGITPKAIIGANTDETTRIGRGVHSYVINYKMNPGFDAAPADDYETTLTYTITAP